MHKQKSKKNPRPSSWFKKKGHRGKIKRARGMQIGEGWTAGAQAGGRAQTFSFFLPIVEATAHETIGAGRTAPHFFCFSFCPFFPLFFFLLGSGTILKKKKGGPHRGRHGDGVRHAIRPKPTVTEGKPRARDPPSPCPSVPTAEFCSFPFSQPRQSWFALFPSPPPPPFSQSGCTGKNQSAPAKVDPFIKKRERQ